MAKRDKDHELRMQGAIWAGNLIKKEGMEAFDRDMRKRNMLRLPMHVTEKQMDEVLCEISENIRSTVLTFVLFALNDTFGFGKKRLNRLVDAINKLFTAIFDLDYMGERYLTMDDLAIDLKERYDVGIDLKRVFICQDEYNKKDENYHFLKVEEVIKNLRESGYGDAADFLQAKID